MYNHMAETNFYYNTQHDVIFAFWVTYKCISLMEEVSYVLGDSYKHFIFNRTFGFKTGTTNGGKACRRLQWMSAHQNTPMQTPMDQIMQLPTMQQSMQPFMQRPTMQLSWFSNRPKHSFIHAAPHNATAYAVYPRDLPVLYNSVTTWWQYVAVTNGSMCNGEFL